MPELKMLSIDKCNELTNIRLGETKLGEKVKIIADNESWVTVLNDTKIKFVVLGIPEDIGILANKGIAGSKSAFNAFLKSFLNIQSTSVLTGSEVLILGKIDCKDAYEALKVADANVHDWVVSVDNIVAEIVEYIVSKGKIPIIIGGGHNNAYGNLKGLSLAKKKPVNVLNIDPHADFRLLEGRHSGNGFSYAFADGYLKNYSILGLHENYNSAIMMDAIRNLKEIKFTFFEDIVLRKKKTWEQALSESINHVKRQFFGLEIDMDSIADTLSSAMTPIGITALQAYQFAYSISQEKNISYLHLAEGVMNRSDKVKSVTMGKLLTYLTTAFIKGHLEKNK